VDRLQPPAQPGNENQIYSSDGLSCKNLPNLRGGKSGEMRKQRNSGLYSANTAANQQIRSYCRFLRETPEGLGTRGRGSELPHGGNLLQKAAGDRGTYGEGKLYYLCLRRSRLHPGGQGFVILIVWEDAEKEKKKRKKKKHKVAGRVNHTQVGNGSRG